MSAPSSLRRVTRYSPAQFALLRIVLGLWLAWQSAELAWWAANSFSAEGGRSNAALAASQGAFFQSDAWVGAQWFSIVWGMVGAGLALALALGWQRRWVALALWFTWAASFLGTGPSSISLLPAVGFLLLLFVVVPDGEPWRWHGKTVAPPDWKMPRKVWLAGWAVLAASYAFSGLVKLFGASEADGPMLGHLINYWFSEPGGLRAAAPVSPAWIEAGWRWGTLAAEIAFLPLCLTRRGRAWAWFGLVALHLSRLATGGFSDLTMGWLMLHGFTFDRAWFPVRKKIGHRPVLLYDGECGLCNAVVRFLLREDDGAVLRFAPLQGPTGQNLLKRAGLPTTDFDSLLFTPDGAGQMCHLRTRGVIGVLDTLGGLWRLVAWVAWLVPSFLRDFAYKILARTRYTLFGAYVPSPLADPRWAGRFIQD